MENYASQSITRGVESNNNLMIDIGQTQRGFEIH